MERGEQYWRQNGAIIPHTAHPTLNLMGLSSTPLRNTFEMQKKDVNEKFDGKTFCAQ
jgi:hypothetical protein